MAASWGSVLTGLIALALVVAISPLTIIPAVLVLQTPRPRPTSLAFLGGWLLGLTALTAAFVAGSDVFGNLHKAPPTWASWARVVIGSALIVFGIFRWFTRQRAKAESPRWMRAFTTISPTRAGIVGLVLTVIRVEVLIICLAAGLAIGTSGLGVAGLWVCGAIYVAFAASTVAVPIVGYAAVGHRLDDPLRRLRDWMEQNNAALLAAVLVLIGLMVLHNGLAAM